MTNLLIAFQVILVILITMSVLLQKSSSIGLGAYSGSNESLFGAKGPAGFLAKFTFILGVLLIANTVALSYLYNTVAKDSVAERILAPNASFSSDLNASNFAPAAPTVNSQGENLQGNENLAPQAPSLPQIPAKDK